MAMHTVIEINHDKAVNLEDKEAGFQIFNIISHLLRPDTEKRLCSHYGIKIIDRHHSSECPNKEA